MTIMEMESKKAWEVWNEFRLKFQTRSSLELASIFEEVIQKKYSANNPFRKIWLAIPTKIRADHKKGMEALDAFLRSQYNK